MSHNAQMSSNPGHTRTFVMTGMASAVVAAMLIAATGCQPKPPAVLTQSPQTQAPQALCHPAQGQELFASDDDAAKGLLAALKEADAAPQPAPAAAPDFKASKVNSGAHVTCDEQYPALCKVLGPLQEGLVSGDPVEDARGFKMFIKHADEKMYIDRPTDSKSILRIGAQDWPFPLPIVKAASGKWFFDTAAGKDEILARKVGRNELTTIKTCRAYVLAQREYAGEDRDDSGVLKYAQRFHSSAGKKDGLYWEAGDDEEQSPLGPMVAGASLKGYDLEAKGALRHTPYQGYYFHILKQQGPAAPGGKYNYVINGNMIAGFALVACPDKYASSGVMTFIISHHGKLYQKDLGPKTIQIVEKMTEYNPDSTWTLVKD